MKSFDDWNRDHTSQDDWWRSDAEDRLREQWDALISEGASEAAVFEAFDELASIFRAEYGD